MSDFLGDYSRKQVEFNAAMAKFEKDYIAKKKIEKDELVNFEDLKPAFPKTNYLLENGQELTNVHARAICEGRPCAIHHPSDHPLALAERSWQVGMIYRLCAHGFDHPDYDSIAYILDREGSITVTHDCCAEKCCGIPEWVDIGD